MSKKNLSEKGSVWRKWDLHVHTPESHGYKGSWDDFENQLINADCAAIGINDYCSVQGYKRLLERMKSSENTLDLGDRVIFPVVELRMTNSVQNKNTKVGSVTHFNFHIIFDNEIDIEGIELFIKSLKSNGTKIGADYNDKSKLINKNVDFFQVIDELKNDVTFEGRYLIWLPYDEYGGIDEINPVSDGWIKENFINQSHIIGSSRKKQADFFLWKSDLNPDGSSKFTATQFKEWFGVKKPCIKGSDSHNSNDLIGMLKDEKSQPTDKHCWIKSELTFEGLKQIVYEPGDRVFIGKKPAVLDRVEKNKTKYIRRLEVRNIPGKKAINGRWFEKVDLDLNPELVAIIGNKGSGKSALTDIIGLLGNTHNAGKDHKYLSFLNNSSGRKKFRKKGFSENFESTLIWEDLSEEKKPLDTNIDNTQVEKVKYLPQSYFESLTNDLEKNSFDLTLKEVIFRHIPESEKYGKKTFAELEEYKSESLNKNLPVLKKELNDISQEIVGLENRKTKSYYKKIDSLLKEKKRELDEHIKNEPEAVEDPSLDKDSSELDQEQQQRSAKLKELRLKADSLISEISIKEQKLNSFVSDLEELKKIRDDIFRFEIQLDTYKKDNTDRYKELGINIDEAIEIKFNISLIEQKITEKLSQVDEVKKLLKSETSILSEYDSSSDQEQAKKESLRAQQELIKNEIISLVQQISKADKDYQEYIDSKAGWAIKKNEIQGDEKNPEKTPGTLAFYSKEKTFIDTKIEGVLTQKRKERLNKTLEIFTMKREMISLYAGFKSSIDDEISKDIEFKKKIKMDIDVSFKISKEFNDKFFKFINQARKGTFLGKLEGEKYLLKVLDEENLLNGKNIEKILKTIIDYLEFDQREDGKPSREITEQVEDVKGFYEYLFSLDYLDPAYDLKLDDKTIDELSPGERGALLLVFYLTIDKEDIPLIIDQPEDNLDNKSVFEVLTHFIRSAKKRRQIIIVTHNPNLAVGADAEQVIHVNLDKKNDYKFTYLTGSIENEDINRCVVDILEGTMPAFDKRKLKYLT